MSYLNTVQANQLCVGDIVHVHYPSTMFVNQKVLHVREETDYIGTKSIDDGVEEGFFYEEERDRTFFLVKPAKKPFPKSIGSVVEVDGVKYVRVIEDSAWFYEWAKSVERHTLDTVSSEYLSTLDYTVV